MKVLNDKELAKAEKLIKSSASSENGPVKDKRKDEEKTRAESPANQLLS